ncbi:MAG: S24/S26 family peptidase [Lacunisphaera sp.]|nr:S24/S26 family peptidase [Lacunisphaera sp.]
MFRRAPWIFSGLVILSGLVGSARETDDPWIRGVFTGRSPRPVVAKETEAWQQAGELAALTPGAFALVGSGESMQPLYAPNTILVMQLCAYEKLQPGQTALYRNKAGKVVAHVLVAKARDGWRATGLNNHLHDMEPVVEENFVGVVIAAFRPTRGDRSVQVASAGRP